jgi:hypothetical protein
MLLEQLKQFGNQLGIHLILAKQEKLASNSLANQLGKNRNLAKLTSPRYACVDRGCHCRFPLGGRVKKEMKNREGFWKGTNIILFLSGFLM